MIGIDSLHDMYQPDTRAPRIVRPRNTGRPAGRPSRQTRETKEAWMREHQAKQLLRELGYRIQPAPARIEPVRHPNSAIVLLAARLRRHLL